MVYNAEQTAKNAEQDASNDPGYCLQQCRIWAGINSMYADAATAWRNTNDRYPGNRQPPRGAAVYWTGGSKGYGHIAISLGNGKVRSTDAGGSGRVATVDLGWVESHWGLPYAGWAWDINEVTIPHDDKKVEDMDEKDLQEIAKRVNKILGEYGPDGKPRDPENTDPDTGNQRLGEILKIVTDVQKKVNDLIKGA